MWYHPDKKNVVSQSHYYEDIPRIEQEQTFH